MVSLNRRDIFIGKDYEKVGDGSVSILWCQIVKLDRKIMKKIFLDFLFVFIKTHNTHKSYSSHILLFPVLA